MELNEFLPDLEATHRFAARFAALIKPGQVVYLYGDLGSGKTSLVQGLLKAWRYQGVVTSPTFTLVEPYRLPNVDVYHFDFYRLQDPEELAFIGIKEYFSKHSICLIEWPDSAAGYIPKADWTVSLSYFEDGRRVHVTT
jgi:tRNA threonylcarbamoyladenosine biosynthesis protein TsaE